MILKTCIYICNNVFFHIQVMVTIDKFNILMNNKLKTTVQ